MSKVIRVPDDLVAEVEAMLVARRVGTGGSRRRVKPEASPVPVAVTEGFESPAPGPLGDPLGRLAVAQALLAKMEVK